MIKIGGGGKPERAAASLAEAAAGPRASCSFHLSGRTSFEDTLTLDIPWLSAFPTYLIFRPSLLS